MQHFHNFELSSDDHSEDNYEPAGIDQPEIDARWFGNSDDEEATVERSLFGKDKADRDIQAAIDTYEYSLSMQNWAAARDEFDGLLKKVSMYERKYGETPALVMEFIRDHDDLAVEMEGKTKRDFADARSFTGLKELHTLIEGLRESYAKVTEEAAVAAAAANEALSAAEEGDLSQEDYAKLIIELAQMAKRSLRFQRLRGRCGDQGYTALEITVQGNYCLALLDEDRGYVMDKSKIENAFKAAEACFRLLKANPTIALVENFRSLVTSNNKVSAIPGGLDGMLSELQKKLLNVAQNTKCGAAAYAWIPLAEERLAELTNEVLAYYMENERLNRRQVLGCCEILLALIGYRTPEAHAMLHTAKSDVENGVLSASTLDTVKAIFRVIAARVGKDSEDMKMSAVCFIGYQLALLGRFRDGCDVLLRAGVPSYLDTQDEYPPQLSILYNRVIARLGLAAFVANEMEETYKLLGSLWENYNPSILIGQGVPTKQTIREEIRYRDQTVQQHFYIPYHQLELAAMLSALVIDTVNEAKKPYERSRVQRYFYRAINPKRRPPVMGNNPMHTQDQVCCAYNALKTGDFFGAKAVVESMSTWKAMVNGQEVLANYLGHLKDAALRVFCFANHTSFTTFSVAQLALKYDMEEQLVRDILNDMISENDTLVAYWDRDDAFLYVDRSNPTRLQHTVLGAADSVVELAPFTERRSRVNEGRGRGAGGRGRGGRGRGGRGTGGRGGIRGN